MSDISEAAFRISDDYLKRPDLCVHPILLGFSKEERAWTNQERSLKEMVDFVMADRMRQLILYTAFYNNKIGYSGFQCAGSIRKEDSRYYFRADPEAFRGAAEKDLRFELPDNENEERYEGLMAAAEKDPACLRAFVVTIENDEESGYYLILRCYPGIEKEEADNLFHREMFLDLLRAAKVHNYKELGKFMNQAQKQFVEYMDAQAGRSK